MGSTNDVSDNAILVTTQSAPAAPPPSRPVFANELQRMNYYNEKHDYMKEIEAKLNNEIGYRFWKRYVNSAFWSYISMPINLSITLLTALSTGQAATDNLLPKTIYVNVALATLILSVLNTYFRPYVQMTDNVELMNKWNDLGCEFESIVYSESKQIEQIEHRLIKYEALMTSVNVLKKQEGLETQNFLTDSIYLGIRSVNCCLKDRDSWLSLDESYKKEDYRRKHVHAETSISPADRARYIDSSMNSVDVVVEVTAAGVPFSNTHDPHGSNVHAHAHAHAHANNNNNNNLPQIRNIVFGAVNRGLLTNRKAKKMTNVMDLSYNMPEAPLMQQEDIYFDAPV